jgi:nucleoside-diphosphate-sugar epimerase
MRVFVAGATGVLGRQVVRELVARGHRVTGLARAPLNEPVLRSLGATPAHGDLFDADSLARAAAGAEVVMHLATALPSVRRPTARDWEPNARIWTDGTACLLEATRRVQAYCYVQQSATFVHGSGGDAWVDENSPLLPHRAVDAAVTMERLVGEAHQRDRLATVILRGGTYYHADSAPTRYLLEGLQTGALPVLGMGANYWSLIHVDDMAHACVLAAEKLPTGETFLVVDDEPVRVRDLFTHLARAVGGPKPNYLPPAVARVLEGSLTVEMATASLRCRNAKIKRQLGWEPRFRTYREGFAAVLKAGTATRG